MSYRKRRFLYSRWRRLVRWEFWPMWALYPPVVLYILYLGLRYRSFTLFTAVNPGIPLGGIALWSKSSVLSALGEGNPNVASFCLIPPKDTLEAKEGLLRAFMEEHRLTFPIVLKPDYGERGKGVAIVKTLEQARIYLVESPDTVIAQEYISGIEFGVFYCRYPKAKTGFIPSLTSKQPTYVTGDGKSTLEQLILSDSRAVCMAPLFLEKHEHRLNYIVPAQESFALSELGTHSRGALFLDADGIKTEAMVHAIDALSQSFDGFYFGRYDIRVPSIEDLQAGQNFKAVELNGVTSEPTHMYDPKHSVFYAWKTLMAQWKIIFEISAQNREQGKQPASFKELRQLLKQFRQKEDFEI